MPFIHKPSPVDMVTIHTQNVRDTLFLYPIRYTSFMYYMLVYLILVLPLVYLFLYPISYLDFISILIYLYLLKP